MDHTKLDQADLDSPRQELSVRGLRIAVELDWNPLQTDKRTVASKV